MINTCNLHNTTGNFRCSQTIYAKLSQALSWLELTTAKVDFVTQMNAEETASYTQLLDLISLHPARTIEMSHSHRPEH